ncbi:hypothetical protein ABMA28_001639 [Loxostege sticticalis]|uniref:Gustatory receptor n=1 Tax=Loxostege sticticalis TaxID=481309 RepID=A0ABD0T2N2_LOXSC
MKRFVPAKDFCVILACDNEINISQKFSLAYAAKPLLYFSNVFGMNMIKYSGNGFIKVKASSKVYSLAFVGAIISLLIFVRPNSWKYTQLDIPLNILTKSYGTLQTFEALYSVFIVSFANSQNYVEMFQVLQKVDWHFGISKNMLGTRRVISIGLVFLPIAQTFCTFFLRKFDIRNSVSHLTFFLTMLQGSLIIFFTINIFIKYLMLNHLLIVKTSGSIPEHKNILFKGSFMGMIFKNILREPLLIENTNKNYSWYELMQIYDKVADCNYIFNKIYSGQVYLLFSSWVICSLLVICRALSPTVKYSEVVFSDLFIYFCLNLRPIYLTKMSELLIAERKKTLSILVSHMFHDNLDNNYKEQVETMIDLVETRKVEISANVYTVNAPVVINSCGHTISYAVIMIQYFYLYMFMK